MIATTPLLTTSLTIGPAPKKHEYRMSIFRDQTPSQVHETVEMFSTIEAVMKRCAALIPAKPYSVEIGLRFSAQVASDGTMLQMTLHIPRPDRDGDAGWKRHNSVSMREWWDMFFEVPPDLQDIVINRVEG